MQISNGCSYTGAAAILSFPGCSRFAAVTHGQGVAKTNEPKVLIFVRWAQWNGKKLYFSYDITVQKIFSLPMQLRKYFLKNIRGSVTCMVSSAFWLCELFPVSSRGQPFPFSLILHQSLIPGTSSSTCPAPTISSGPETERGDEYSTSTGPWSTWAWQHWRWRAGAISWRSTVDEPHRRFISAFAELWTQIAKSRSVGGRNDDTSQRPDHQSRSQLCAENPFLTCHVTIAKAMANQIVK